MDILGVRRKRNNERTANSPAAAVSVIAMELQKEQILSKTLKGIDAARGRGSLSSKLQSILRLVDGAKNVSELTAAAKSPEAEARAALTELHEAGLVRLVERPSSTAPQDKISAETENQLRLTLDFTKKTHDHQQEAAAAVVASSAKPASAASAPPASPPAAGAASAVDHEALAREARGARLKLEADIRQKLLVTLQPRIEEELRKRLRPKLEEELRPKLIAALRPGLEAEVRTALVKELTPRIELELKARFAKTLAAQKAASEQAAREEAEVAPPSAPVAPIATVLADAASGRVMASLSTPVFSVDKTGVCTYMSPAWAQFSGFTADEAVGRQLTDFFDDKSRRAIAAMLSGVCNGTALRFEQQGAFARKDDSSLWVEVMAAPLYSPSGETEGVCGSIRDAGELRRVSLQAEADGVRLLLLVDQIDTGVLLENEAGDIQQVNPAFCTLLSVDAAPYSLEGLPVSELLEQVSQGFIGPEGFLRRIADMRNAGEEVKGESFILADGRVIEQDYLAVTAGEQTVGRVWLFREVRKSAKPTKPALRESRAS